MIEAIRMCEEITGKKLNSSYNETNRTGDHIWWISDNSKFNKHYPEWGLTYTIDEILKELFEKNNNN